MDTKQKAGFNSRFKNKRGKGDVVMVTAKAESGFDFIVHDKLGEISVTGRYSKELRVIEWGRYDAKFDIRPWDTSDPDGKRMNKGLTFTKDEIIKLKEILDGIDFERYEMPVKKIEPAIV